MAGLIGNFIGRCSISVEIRWIEVLAVPLPYFAWVKISHEYKAVLIAGMLALLVILWRF